eukprot:Hpha_TRINITY_DN9267_c0_g1::TRINITY_DN9267_c0_g1_i1::g.28575::m.28575
MVASAGFIAGRVPPLPIVPRGARGSRANTARGVTEADKPATSGDEADDNSARVFRRVGGGFEPANADGSPMPRPPSPRRQDLRPRPPTELFGVGTHGLGGGCNESLTHYEKVQRKRWLQFRIKQLAIQEQQAVKPGPASPSERLAHQRQQKQREKELREEEMEKKAAAIALEHKKLKQDIEEVRTAAETAVQQEVSQQRQQRRAQREQSWQYFSDSLGLWEDFVAAQNDQIERAAREGKQTVSLTVDPSYGPAAVLVVDIEKVSAELRPDGGHIPVRRRAVVKCPQNGLRVAPVTKGELVEQSRRDAAQQEEATLEFVRARRALWLEARNKLRVDSEARQADKRQMARRDKDKYNARWESTRKSRKDYGDRQKEGIQAGRRAQEAQKEQAKEAKQSTLETTVRELRKQREGDRARRRAVDAARMENLKRELDSLRGARSEALAESKAQCQATAPLQDASLTLSRAQWHSRAANLGGVREQRDKRKEAVIDREADREAELRRCADLHNSVIDACQRRRARGIAGGGAGFGERTGGIVVVSPRRVRRPQSDDDED